MKVREYLNLVKFLDSKNRNELNNFVLKPSFNISPNIKALALSGGWNLNTSNIEFPEQYSYLLEFYVINDRYDSLFSYCDENNKFHLSTIVLEITPQRTLYEPKIPNEILEEIVKNAIHEHDKAVDKRNDGKWFIWQ